MKANIILESHLKWLNGWKIAKEEELNCEKCKLASTFCLLMHQAHGYGIEFVLKPLSTKSNKN